MTVLPPRPAPTPAAAAPPSARPRSNPPVSLDRVAELGVGLPLVGVMYVVVAIVWIAEQLMRRRAAIRS